MISDLSSRQLQHWAVVPVLAVGAATTVGWLWKTWTRHPLPPGPTSTRDIDMAKFKAFPYLVYTEWKEKYGPISYYTFHSPPTLVLNSPEHTTGLLDGPLSKFTSDRSPTYMAGVLANRQWTVFGLSSEHPWFKVYRRLLHAALNPRACASRAYREVMEREVGVLVREFGRRPEGFLGALQRSATAVMLKLAYGFQLGEYRPDEPFVKLIDETFALSGELRTPGKYLVETFPLLRFVPEWFPGAGFKRHAKAVGKQLEEMWSVPFEWTKRQINSGTYSESFISKFLLSDTAYIKPEEKEEILNWCSSAFHVGGGDTTVSAMTTLMLMMQLYPEVQQRAQADLDRITAGRLPVAEDYKSLPYFSALIKEILRWGVVAPSGLPHATTKDLVYSGFRIPRGTRIVPNIWAITHDPEVYPDPEKFDPQRYMGENPQPDPLQYVFGFGRRRCPGAHFAEAALFLNMSTILAVYTISKEVVKNEDGTEVVVEPRVEWEARMTNHLKPFGCLLTPRDNGLLTVVMEQDDPEADGL